MKKTEPVAFDQSLRGKTVAVTGASGDLGRQLCRRIAGAGGNLILLDRNPERSRNTRQMLLSEFPGLCVSLVPLDLTDFSSVERACEALEKQGFDMLIHNAGVYKTRRSTCQSGCNNSFQVNFLSPYYMTERLMPCLEKRPDSRVVMVASIAHRYGRADGTDPDYSRRKSDAKVYGNAKRCWMITFFDLISRYPSVNFSVVHPGIAVTRMTGHFPKALYLLMKPVMRLLFTTPQRASVCLFAGLFQNCVPGEWIGPRLFDIWGRPVRKRLTAFSPCETETVLSFAQKELEKMRLAISTDPKMPDDPSASVKNP